MELSRNAEYPSQPISPGDVLALKAETMPEEAFIAMNGLITERLHGQYAQISIKALKKRMEELGLNKKEIEERSWDRIGAIYKERGWKISLHTPSFDDAYDFDPYYYVSTDQVRSW